MRVTLVHVTLRSCGMSMINVGCTLGMVALGSNREGCGIIGNCCWRQVAGVGRMVASVRCGVSVVVATEKSLERRRMAFSWSSPSVSNGDAGAGSRSASTSILAASAALLDAELLGILMSCGKNSTVRAIRSALVFVMYTV